MEHHVYWLLKSSCFELSRMGNTVFFEPKSWWKMIFTDYWEVLVLKCSETGNTVLLWAKKLMKGTIFTWSFWAFHDILGLGRYDFLCSVKYTIRLLSDGVFHAKSLGKF